MLKHSDVIARTAARTALLKNGVFKIQADNETTPLTFILCAIKDFQLYLHAPSFENLTLDDKDRKILSTDEVKISAFELHQKGGAQALDSLDIPAAAQRGNDPAYGTGEVVFGTLFQDYKSN